MLKKLSLLETRYIATETKHNIRKAEMITKTAKYIPIATANLRVNTVLDFDIFIKTGNKIVLFRKHHLPFTEDTLTVLTTNKITSLFVLEKDLEKLEKYCGKQEDSKCSISLDDLDPPFDNPENLEKYYKTYLNYYPIEKGTLLPGTKVNFNVYKKSNLDVELFIGPNKQENLPSVVPEEIQEIQSAIAIHNNDIPLYKDYINDITLKFSKNDKDTSGFQHSILRENSKFIIKDILGDPRSGETIQKASELVQNLTESILENQSNFANLLTINTHDYYTYTHSLNVCSLSIGLGTELKLRKDPDLFELGMGALLHDIGKCTIEPRILNKPGKLTNEEFTNVQSHVIAAKTILNNNSTKIPHNSLLTILQHHEKLTGEGYPYNLKGSQISIFGRICALVDFYDALTTERSYKKAFSPFEAFELLSKIKDYYDQALIKKFIVMLGNQVK